MIGTELRRSEGVAVFCNAAPASTPAGGPPIRAAVSDGSRRAGRWQIEGAPRRPGRRPNQPDGAGFSAQTRDRSPRDRVELRAERVVLPEEPRRRHRVFALDGRDELAREDPACVRRIASRRPIEERSPAGRAIVASLQLLVGRQAHDRPKIGEEPSFEVGAGSLRTRALAEAQTVFAHRRRVVRSRMLKREAQRAS